MSGTDFTAVLKLGWDYFSIIPNCLRWQKIRKYIFQKNLKIRFPNCGFWWNTNFRKVQYQNSKAKKKGIKIQENMKKKLDDWAWL